MDIEIRSVTTLDVKIVLIIAVIIGSVMVPSSVAAPDQPVIGKFVNSQNSLVLDLDDDENNIIEQWIIGNYWQVSDNIFCTTTTGKWKFLKGFPANPKMIIDRTSKGTFHVRYMVTFTGSDPILLNGNVDISYYGTSDISSDIDFLIPYNSKKEI